MSEFPVAEDGTQPVPRVSIVIPVYNEEAILQTALVDLIDRLREFGWPYEIIVAENGSKDATVEIATSLADRVYLTVDNPRREPLEQITADVSPGLARGGAPWIRLDDRAAAIRQALRASRPGDLLVLLGKGDEGYQDVDGVKHPYSDRETARRELAALERAGGNAAEGRPAGAGAGAGHSHD